MVATEILPDRTALQLERVQSLEVKTTSDGSPTLFVPALQEHYHSVHGAVQESKHVFIGAGLREAVQQGAIPVRVLEVGFGTGLNALLTLQESLGMPIEVVYHTLEAYPLPWPTVAQLQFNQAVPGLPEQYILELHRCPWEQEVRIGVSFRLLKRQGLLEVLPLADNFYHVIYFDAFAPGKQPELWTEEIFRKCFGCLQTNGILVTYCAKGEVKRQLKAVGFTVETLPGPPGKREMIRARKPAL